MITKTYMNILRFLLFISLMSMAVSCGQQKKFITYKIKKGEKINDIANHLGVKNRYLLRLNPDVSRVPKEGTEIIIPDKGISMDNIPVSKDENDEILNNSVKVEKIQYSYKTHTVKPHETVYSLTKKYEISKETLMEWNPQYPELKNNTIKVGQVLNVGRVESKTFEYISKEDSEDADEQEYLMHSVLPHETLYSITQKYSVTQEQLIKLNPQYPDLKDDIIYYGDILKIKPLNNEDKNGEVYTDELKIGEPIKIALMLPFEADKYTDQTPNRIFNKNKVANLITDFYLGAEMAIDSIRKQHIDVNVDVYDTGKKGRLTQKIINTNQLDDLDVIIGPFFADKAKLVADKTSVPIIFPHYSKQQNSFSASKLVKSSPEINEYINTLTEYLKEIYKGETIFIVGDNSTDSNEEIKDIIAKLQKHDDINNEKLHVLKPEKGYIKKERFTDKMGKDSHNWLIIASDDTSVVSDVLNSFVVLPKGITAQVFALRKGKAYNKVDNNKLADLGFVYVTDYFVDQNNKAIQEFIQKYRNKNNLTPTPYAVKGFDITYDALARLASRKRLKKSFKDGASTRIGYKFNYKNKFFSSVANRGLFIVKYNKDLSLSRLK